MTQMGRGLRNLFTQPYRHASLDRLLLPISLIIYSCMLGLYQWERAAISNVDYWLHMGVGERFSPDHLASYINGFYPIGYPLLLKMGMHAGIDMLRYGQIISWAGGLLLIVAAYYILKHLHLPTYIIAMGIGAILLSSYFMGLAAREGNDALALGLQFFSLMLLLRFLQQSQHTNFVSLVASASTLAFAYLTRYTALVFLPVMVGAIVFSAKPMRNYAKLISIFCGVFVLVSVIQWLPSLIETGNPIYNTQAKNVWFGMYGNGDWVANWKGSPDNISLATIILSDPLQFMQHWLTQSFLALKQSFYLPIGGFYTWIVLVTMLIVWERPAQQVTRMLTVLITVAVVSSVVTSMAWFNHRFIAPQFVIETVLFFWCLSRLVRIVTQSFTRPFLGILLLVGAFMWILNTNLTSIIQWYSAPVLRWSIEANTLLKNMGMVDGREVITNNDYFHDSTTPNRVRYNLTSYAIHAPQSFDELLDFAPNARFIALDFVGGSANYHGLRSANGVPLDKLVPIYAQENFEVYCVLPCHQPNQQAVNVIFGDVIRLDSMAVYAADDFVGVYFFWTALQDITKSYKVSIRLMDENSNIILQRDNQPQMWFRPTFTWQMEDQIVDFHYLDLTDVDECMNCTLQLVVYDELTQEPIMITFPLDMVNKISFQIRSWE